MFFSALNDILFIVYFLQPLQMQQKRVSFPTQLQVNSIIIILEWEIEFYI